MDRFYCFCSQLIIFKQALIRAEDMKPLLSKEEIADLLAPLEPEPGMSPAEKDTDSLPNMPLQVRVEVGRCRILHQELLQIKEGSVVTLEKSADEPIDLYVDNLLIARGELVQVGSKVAVKVTKVFAPTESLGKQE